MSSVAQASPLYKKSKIWLYAPLWCFFVYLYIQILGWSQDSSNLLLGGLYFIEFGVHEASHIVTAWLPQIICAAAGSIGEMSFTILIAVAAWREKSYFALSFALLWVMLAMNSAGIYMADARAQKLQLIGLGPEPRHDWNFVFGQLGWLDWDTVIGGSVRFVGDVVGLVGLAIGLILIIKMIADKNRR
jgi:hypothetical protein